MTSTELRADDLVLAYQRATVVHGVSVRIRPGTVTALIGPNGSGKSTVLRSMARLHPVRDGAVRVVDAEPGVGAPAGAPGGGESAVDAHAADAATAAPEAAPLSAREFARRVTLLSQTRPHPSGLDIRDVVAFGRHPHRRRFAGISEADRLAIDRALVLTGLAGMADRPVDQLSGGELQRVWFATCLAQQTDVLLLDEPTNHLDLRYQVETLDLVRELADEHGSAIGVVLHDLGHAATVADEVVLLHGGRVRAAGTPEEVLTAEHLSEVYGLPIEVDTDPGTGFVRVHPRGRHHQRVLV